MKPIISTAGKSTQLRYRRGLPTHTPNHLTASLRYELPHRVYGSKIYPVPAPNGSTIILYGQDTGVGILWRGGRPLKKTAPAPQQPPKPPAKVNGTRNDVIMIDDSDDDEPPKADPQPPPEAEFEDEEEELDPDYPYPSIVQHLRLPLNTEVLHIAVPQLPVVSALRPADSIPPIFSKKIVCTVACADYSILVITLPLSPPSDAAKASPFSAKSPYGAEILRISAHAGHQSIARGITMTWTGRAEPTPSRKELDDDMAEDEDDDTAATPGRQGTGEEGWDLLVASHSAELGGLLKIWRFKLADTTVNVPSPMSAYKTLTLRKPASRVAFSSAQYPRPRHSQLLITDSSGIARIYDPFAPSSRKRRTNGANTGSGNFAALFKTTFDNTKSDSPTPPLLVARKPILDAAWAADGHQIVALLADGEWGVWDVDRSGPSPPSDPASFSLRGFVGTFEKDRSGNGLSSPKSRSSRGSLVPMTPNTRRTKEEVLFHGTSHTSTPYHGGVSIASSPSTDGGASEDSVIIWYGSEVFRIPNLAKFWSRTASASNGASLPAAGPSLVQGLPLLGETITSIEQFKTTAEEAKMATPRDLLTTAEHRLIIFASRTEPLGRDLNAVFAKEQAEEQDGKQADQALLARGELDLGGMDRLLEDMEGSGSGSRSMVLGNSRKVLFASSTA
ncbi:hypothetical protein BDV95DRAFT_578369 [Massariosphaeria phaeospora]|uniref:Uncharacterized protein n=1 Tax=Massariosphaeria phaeospora TaxID=100035 RepID=A0A7C8M3G9_9PLEO|nr:hypothetical protein BDV95DRAFT_578369 [Massariosphaeria phaeospora]